MSVERIILMRHADYYFDQETRETKITERDCEWGLDALRDDMAMERLGGSIPDGAPILHSSADRARLTAEWFGKALGSELFSSEDLHTTSLGNFARDSSSAPLHMTSFLINELGRAGEELLEAAGTLLVICHEPLVGFVDYGGERATHCSPVLLNEEAYASRL